MSIRHQLQILSVTPQSESIKLGRAQPEPHHVLERGGSVNKRHFLSRTLKTIRGPLTLSISISTCVSLSAFGGTSWEEEVLLHDGSKIVVSRSVDRGGRHEIGQQPPIKEQSLTFTLPPQHERITWKSEFSKDIGLADVQPLLLDISQGSAYVITNPVGCLAYNKWGRPNPPYVVFKYEGKEWKRISLQELPAEIRTPNIIFGAADNDVEKLGVNCVKWEDGQRIKSSLERERFEKWWAAF